MYLRPRLAQTPKSFGLDHRDGNASVYENHDSDDDDDDDSRRWFRSNYGFDIKEAHSRSLSLDEAVKIIASKNEMRSSNRKLRAISELQLRRQHESTEITGSGYRQTLGKRAYTF